MLSIYHTKYYTDSWNPHKYWSYPPPATGSTPISSTRKYAECFGVLSLHLCRKSSKTLNFSQLSPDVPAQKFLTFCHDFLRRVKYFCVKDYTKDYTDTKTPLPRFRGRGNLYPLYISSIALILTIFSLSISQAHFHISISRDFSASSVTLPIMLQPIS